MKILKVQSNMELPNIDFIAANDDKKGEGVIEIRFSNPSITEQVPWVRIITNKPLPYVIVNAFNRFHSDAESKVQSGTVIKETVPK